MTETTTATMKAAVIPQWGGPEVVEYTDTVRPEPGEDQILVRVEACSLNHLDILVRRGLPGVKLDLPHITGGDIVGVVESAGGPEGESLVGQRILVDPLIFDPKSGYGVIGEHRHGGLAEYIAVPAKNAIPLQDGDPSPEVIACLPIAYGTAHRMLFTRGRVREGETVVVLGSTGGVGVACTQLGSRAGARVIVCSTSDEKLERMRTLGAAETINVAKEDFRKRVRELTGPTGPEVIVDYQGEETWPDTIKSVGFRGRILICGATTGFDAKTDLRYLFGREAEIIGCAGWTREDLETLLEMTRKGEIEPPIHGVYPLSKVSEAVAELEERRAFGKVVVVPDSVAS